MLRPVGSQPPAVYWRRRLIFVVLPALLVLLMIIYLFSGNGSSKQNAGATTSGTSTRSSVSTARSSTGAAPTSSVRTTPTSTPATHSSGPSNTVRTSTSGTAPATVRLCSTADLRVEAQTGKPSYVVNSRPDLYLLVTNIATTPCRQDLGDPKIVLTVYTGDVRVWASHDCSIEPGVSIVTLAAKAAQRREILWSGQTSTPGCSGTRMIAQASTYTLTASLAGQTSSPVTFKLTAA